MVVPLQTISLLFIHPFRIEGTSINGYEAFSRTPQGGASHARGDGLPGHGDGPRPRLLSPDRLRRIRVSLV
ncbi:hypothetical protein GS909_20580 [Rhodococcus hoagii]|nr:hypothetical protein [Prescottella equi]